MSQSFTSGAFGLLVDWNETDKKNRVFTSLNSNNVWSEAAKRWAKCSARCFERFSQGSSLLRRVSVALRSSRIHSHSGNFNGCPCFFLMPRLCSLIIISALFRHRPHSNKTQRHQHKPSQLVSKRRKKYNLVLSSSLWKHDTESLLFWIWIFFFCLLDLVYF